ncbi:dihydrofolate reductase [Candidatus Berkiella aquae]|uniref:Dihydrofolate reductase n=1 Tax=Candidatus Berkiella aquae TaxID=295108 RepID=A0A0Q9YXI8_9GAMM|nr:dihydrofolate reductase [Candidatus Berkiella aquae]MCS5712549.1 dihydrofolate reductase [Candidatus Berkiella aquae]
MKKISFVVAMAENKVIGHNNQLLWHLPNDLKHFKELTIGKPIIMGRKTYESIGKPLPERQNIILTQQALTLPGCDVVHSVEEALAKAGTAEEVMVIGGGEIYRLFFPQAHTLYITLVHTTLNGETTFVEFDQDAWEETAHEEYFQDAKHAYDYSFITMERRG